MNYGTSLLSHLENRLNNSQIQARYNMMISPEIFRMPVTRESEVQEVYYQIVCGTTECRYKTAPSEAPSDVERCE